jgi:hypothetical protein
VEFIPPTEKGEKEKPQFIREKDLKGHIPMEKRQEDETKRKGEDIETEEQVKILLEKDNQVRYALQLLQTWNIFSQIKTRP